jgi:hypothetical protein
MANGSVLAHPETEWCLRQNQVPRIFQAWEEAASDVTGLVEVLVGWLATSAKSQPVGAFFGLQLAGYRKSCSTG